MDVELPSDGIAPGGRCLRAADSVVPIMAATSRVGPFEAMRVPLNATAVGDRPAWPG